MSNDLARTVESLLVTLSDDMAQMRGLNDRMDALQEKMEKLRRAIFGLAGILEEHDLERLKRQYPEIFEEFLDGRLGLTDVVRDVLKTAPEILLTPTDVRDRVLKTSRALEGHKSPLGSIHTVLKRLSDNDEAVQAHDSDGKTLYGWIGDEEGLNKVLPWLSPADKDGVLRDFRRAQQKSSQQSQTPVAVKRSRKPKQKS